MTKELEDEIARLKQELKEVIVENTKLVNASQDELLQMFWQRDAQKTSNKLGTLDRQYVKDEDVCGRHGRTVKVGLNQLAKDKVDAERKRD